MNSKVGAKLRPKHALVRDTAAQWVTRLEGPTDPRLWDEFERWLSASPRHQAEFIRLRAAWRQSDCLRRLLPLDGTVDADLLSFPLGDLWLGRRNDPPAKKAREQGSSHDAKQGASDRQRKIVLLPGARLAAIAEFILTRGTFRRYVRPIIADMQDEYVECIAKGDDWRARWVAVRGHLLVVPGWIYALVSRALQKLFSA